MAHKTIIKLGLGIILSAGVLAMAFIGCGGSSSSNSGSSAVYEAKGITDTAFGSSGVITTSITGAPCYDKANALALQADGKILAGGSTNNGVTTEFALVRYNANGTLDTGFSDDGVITTTIGNPNSAINALDIQADGKIVAAGFANMTGQYCFALARYTITGTLDTTFGTAGVTTTAIFTYAWANAVKVQTDGKIVVAGKANNGNQQFALARYTAFGALDDNFGVSGVATADIGTADDLAYALAIQPDGKILIAGHETHYGKFALLRYNANGTLDSSFGTAGLASTLVGDGMDSGNGIGLVLQPDGKVLLAGHAYNGSDVDFALVRYTISGTADASFGGGDGVVTTTISSVYDYLYGAALQSNGKIVACGITNVGSSLEDFVVARYNSDGALDTSFGGGDGLVISHVSQRDYPLSVLVQPDGLIVIGGYVWYASGNQRFGLLRYK